MKIVTRYILGTYLKLLGLCIGGLASLYLILDFLEKIRRFTKAKTEIGTILVFFACKLPMMIAEVMPLAVLLATMLAMGSLSRTQELTAMRSCGMSLKSITGPILATAFAVSVALLFAREFVIPQTYQQARYIEDVKLKKVDYGTFFRQNNIWYREGNVVMQAKLFDPRTRVLKGITLWENSGVDPVRRIDAKEGEWISGQWVLRDVTERDFRAESLVATTDFREKTFPLKLTVNDLKKVAKDAEDMGFLELRRYCNKLTKGGFDATRYLADMHAKIAVPFGCLIMAFLGVPFSLRGGRSGGTASGIAKSLGVGFAYMVTSAVFLSFGHNGILPPAVSAWAANFLFAVGGAWLTLTMER
jgi:lipopolysaccharide export system permease protein